jgi:hypothetical protein
MNPEQKTKLKVPSKLEGIQNKIAIQKGYPSWEEMENFIIDNNFPQNIASMLVQAMKEVCIEYAK